jgi:hypothetical protein
MSKQSLLAMDVAHVSGVERYVVKHAQSDDVGYVRTTGVEKYLRKQN